MKNDYYVNIKQNCIIVRHYELLAFTNYQAKKEFFRDVKWYDYDAYEYELVNCNTNKTLLSI
jgi:hypothetical protein